MASLLEPIIKPEAPQNAIWQFEVSLSENGGGYRIDARGYSDFSIQATLISGGWGSAEITVKRSNDDLDYYELATPKDFNSGSSTYLHDLDDFKQPFLWAPVTTADPSAGRVLITVSARKD